MIPVALAVFEVMLEVIVQTAAVWLVLRYIGRARGRGRLGASAFRDSIILARAMVVLFLGHVVQIALWAVPFRVFGQFEDFRTAFYHSAVNYASLGYGDIVMTGDWRIVGALEAASGVLMFGVSTATFFALMSPLVKWHGGRDKPGK